MSHTDSQDAPVMDAALAWQALLAGNRRYASGAGHHPHQSAYRRVEVLPAQHPFAVIIGCSDSRVPPEIIFDFDSRGAGKRGARCSGQSGSR